MTGLPIPPPGAAVVVRGADCETLANDAVTLQLLAGSSATGGALSSLRVTLCDGADGANPHRHDRSSELFYVLDGTVQLLAGDDVLIASGGDLVVVPPGLPHAFAAPAGRRGDLLVIVTPGVERFEYFRQLARIAEGQQPAESLLAVQQRYDTYFLDSTAWQVARSDGPSLAGRRAWVVDC